MSSSHGRSCRACPAAVDMDPNGPLQTDELSLSRRLRGKRRAKPCGPGSLLNG